MEIIKDDDENANNTIYEDYLILKESGKKYCGNQKFKVNYEKINYIELNSTYKPSLIEIPIIENIKYGDTATEELDTK